MKLHADEFDIDIELVRLLVSTQHPQWANLKIATVASGGTDNAIFRLGDRLLVRLPKMPAAEAQILHEQAWLPKLATELPLAIPKPIAIGTPSISFPCHWSVYEWIEGDMVSLSSLPDLNQAALDLAAFISALQKIDTAGGPKPGLNRGVTLEERDQKTRQSIQEASDLIDAEKVLACWQKALTAAPWHGGPVWRHGDLQSSNMLATGGRLCAILDFASVGIGDPAGDLTVAWNFLDKNAREIFQRELRPDPATWERGKGWALSIALIALPYYRNSSPAIGAACLRTISQIVEEWWH